MYQVILINFDIFRSSVPRENYIWFVNNTVFATAEYDTYPVRQLYPAGPDHVHPRLYFWLWVDPGPLVSCVWWERFAPVTASLSPGAAWRRRCVWRANPWWSHHRCIHPRPSRAVLQHLKQIILHGLYRVIELFCNYTKLVRTAYAVMSTIKSEKFPLVSTEPRTSCDLLWYLPDRDNLHVLIEGY